VLTLIAAGDLVRTTSLREDTNVDVFDVSACNGDWDYVFRFARSSAGVTADAAGMVDYLCPLNWAWGACHLSNYNIDECRFSISDWRFEVVVVL
jgi:hypothetical protein